MTHENITKALHNADFLLGDLIAANRTADPVVNLHLLRMIATAATLLADLKALSHAMDQQ